MRLVSLVLVTSLALITAACGRGETEGGTEQIPPGLKAFYGQRLEWKECGGGIQCTRLDVPADYADPAGRRIKLVVNRRPAGNKSARIGSLVTNPGGPGVGFVRETATRFGKDVKDRFDIVGFDPRGFGGSEPVHCLPDRDKYAFGIAAVPAPDDQAGLDKYLERLKKLAATCTERSPHIAQVGTANTARDLDILRAALGDPRLSFYGASYGTYLGTVYAESFPRNVRALVLDSAVDTTMNPAQTGRLEALRLEVALRSFAADCLRRPRCPLGTGDVDEAITRINAAEKAADRGRLENTADDREINSAVVAQGVAFALPAKETWPALREALADAEQDDGTGLLRLKDRSDGRTAGGGYASDRDGEIAVKCADRPVLPSMAGYLKHADKTVRLSSRFGRFLAWPEIHCQFLPRPAAERPTAKGAPGAPPILVIGTTRDLAAPYAWAGKLATHLESGVLLTLDGDGHIAYLQGNPCIGAATDSYLVTARPPKSGTTCRP